MTLSVWHLDITTNAMKCLHSRQGIYKVDNTVCFSITIWVAPSDWIEAVDVFRWGHKVLWDHGSYSPHCSTTTNTNEDLSSVGWGWMVGVKLTTFNQETTGYQIISVPHNLLEVTQLDLSSICLYWFSKLKCHFPIHVLTKQALHCCLVSYSVWTWLCNIQPSICNLSAASLSTTTCFLAHALTSIANSPQ